jgi:lipid A oxidase
MRQVLRLALAFACVLVPAAANAQWSFSTFTGVNHTLPSSIAIERPDIGMAVEFRDVEYDARPFTSPQYYGARLTRFFGDRRLGVEIEFLHIKVYARTHDVVQVRGTIGDRAVDERVPMRTYVHRYNHTHGLNFLFANVAWRYPVGGAGARTTLSVRGGAGPVVPGVDVVMPGLNVQGYQFTGIGAQAAAGVTIRFSTWVSALVEYKFTHTRPQVDLVAGGRGRMTASTHNLAMGLTIGR